MPRSITFERMAKKTNRITLKDTCLKAGFPLKPETGEWETKGNGTGRKLSVGHPDVTGDGLKPLFGESTVSLF